MAKLHSYYVLCPLIDQKSFLGVSESKEKENVLVTLGRNVVNKYRLSDQKQIGGWTSKDHITSAVVYDHDLDSYVGIFNNNMVRTWNDDTKSLDKIKKQKFSTNILKLIARKNQSSLIVFANGNCVSLSHGLENRKSSETKSFLRSGDKITDVVCYSVGSTEHVCYIVKNSKEKYEIVTCPLNTELGDLLRPKLSKTKIVRSDSDADIVGKLICTAESPAVYILWSDSKMHVFDLTKAQWKVAGTVPWISTASSVSMEWMGQKHLILFGSDSDEEGAIIVAFNVALGVGSCRYPMKMYCEDAKLYCMSDRIILEASNHIGILPYALESNRSLSSLLGTHDIQPDEFTELADWGVGEAPVCKADGHLQVLLNQGLTERNICSQLIPPLTESGDFAHLLKIIKEFNDVPESIIVMLIKYAVGLFHYEVSSLTNKEDFKLMCTKNNDKEGFFNYLFCLPFSDAILIPYLRNGLTLNDALFVLTYISYLLEDPSVRSLKMDTESKLLDWCSLLMDAFYQQYLITKDETVAITLDTMRNVVNNLISQLNDINDVLPVLNTLLVNNNNDVSYESLTYTIEMMEI